MNLKHTSFQFAHIEDITDQFEQMSGRQLNLIQTVINFFPVISVFTDDIYHSHDSIDRRTNIMTHAIHKFRLGPVFRIRFFISHLQTRFFLLFLFMKIWSILKQNNSMDYGTLFICIRIIHHISGHQNCFLQPYRLIFFSHHFAVFYCNLLRTCSKSLQ